MIEVFDVDVAADHISLSGTASVSEGNVLVGVTAGAGPYVWYSAQAEVGAPGRGPWVLELSRPAGVVRLMFGEEDAKDGGLSSRSKLMIEIAADGQLPPEIS